MTTDDSRILDFYVDDFDVNTDGKRFYLAGYLQASFNNEGSIEQNTSLSKTVGGRLIASTLVQERSHLSNGSMDDHNRGSGQMMDGTQINIDVTALEAIISLGLMYLKALYPTNTFRISRCEAPLHNAPCHFQIRDLFEKLTVATAAAAGHLEIKKLTMAKIGVHLEVEKLTVA
ncbi:unnamed protein product [Lactuca saligna]|uniref:Uncharacterized protein n=1 Tax=Lactuca saligna TaxID=75948 RepID=A0AA36ERC7_LACSI|nr:unnamed protein product [Lactuca saligna]